MKHRTAAYLAAAWAIVFAAPHIYWATGRKDGPGHRAQRAGRTRRRQLVWHSRAPASPLFCLCGAAAAMTTVQDWPARGRRCSGAC